jgi:uncharacterized protein YecE (DUF72 family)
VGDPLLHVGTSGWSYPDWIGPFYPTGTVARDFLARGLAVFAFANNRFQGHGPATARALLARVAGNGIDL